jgi:hypothetical protein
MAAPQYEGTLNLTWNFHCFFVNNEDQCNFYSFHGTGQECTCGKGPQKDNVM